jgi:RNA polymerase sigma-70 factor (ECF subfamily)
MRDKDLMIITAVLAGNTRAYGQLVDRYKERGMGLAMRLLRDREEAEEALQDAFVRAYRALADFEGRSAFGTWFYRILYNVCNSRLELRRTATISLESEEGMVALQQRSDEPLPDSTFESREFERIVAEEIERLPEPYGSAFALFALRDLSYEEICGILGAPLGTVKARIFRARGLLREAVGRRIGRPIEVVGNEGDRS